jgi:hypothetical protein
MLVSKSPRIELHNCDCITGMAEHVPAESVHLVISSIPFESLFTYSGKTEDVGNNESTVDLRAGRFALNMRFFCEQLNRVLAPGCNAAIHIQQLLAYRNQHGFMGRRDFRGAMVDVFRASGLNFVGEFVIPKNPQQAAQRLKLHSLQFKTGHTRNGCMLAPFVNDYVLIFQRPGEHPCPPKPLRSRENPGGWVTSEEWIRDAHGVWADILEVDVLDTALGLESPDERHPCALQLEVIRRCVRLYTNPVHLQPDVTVLDPFMGIGSTAFVCAGGGSPVTKLNIEEPRNCIGFELKESYFKASLNYVRGALRSAERPAERSLYAELETV